MINQKVVRAAYYLRISTETQELGNQRAEIIPFVERRGWKLVHPFEDVMSGRKTEKDRPGFAAMLKAAHQRNQRFALVRPGGTWRLMMLAVKTRTAAGGTGPLSPWLLFHNV